MHVPDAEHSLKGKPRFETVFIRQFAMNANGLGEVAVVEIEDIRSLKKSSMVPLSVVPFGTQLNPGMNGRREKPRKGQGRRLIEQGNGDRKGFAL